MIVKSRTLIIFVTIAIMIMMLNIYAIFADERTNNLQSVTLEDFELEGGKPKRYWSAVPDRFGREGNLDSGKSLQEVSWIESWPESYFGKEGTFDDGNEVREYKNCLAVKLAFNRQGYHYVELYPLEQKDGKYHKSPIPFKGRVQQIDMWIWGSNYDYYMEVILMDYRGVEHRIPMGSIRHAGWKNITIPIPNYIPQSTTHIPALNPFSLVKLVVWTTPHEKVSGSYLYVDHIKYLSDIFETKYDGYGLGDIDTVKKLWEKGPKAPDEKDVMP